MRSTKTSAQKNNLRLKEATLQMSSLHWLKKYLSGHEKILNLTLLFIWFPGFPGIPGITSLKFPFPSRSNLQIPVPFPWNGNVNFNFPSCSRGPKSFSRSPLISPLQQHYAKFCNGLTAFCNKEALFIKKTTLFYKKKTSSEPTYKKTPTSNISFYKQIYFWN